MKLFGRRKTDAAAPGGREILQGQPLPGGRRSYDPPAYVEPASPNFDEMGLYEDMTFEELVADNKALRMELAGLKSRLSYIKTVLLANVPVMEFGNVVTPSVAQPQVAPVQPAPAQPAPMQAAPVQPAPFQAQPAQPAGQGGQAEVQALLAQLKQDIAAMSASSPQAVPTAAGGDDEVRRMLAELKNDITNLKGTPAPAPAAGGDDEVRRMLAELKNDITTLKSAPAPAPAPVQAGGGIDEVRQMLAELKNDITTLKSAPPVSGTPTHGLDDEVRQMLAQLKNDITELKGGVRKNPAAQDGQEDVRALLKKLHEDIASLKAPKAAPAEAPAPASAPGEEDGIDKSGIDALLSELDADEGAAGKADGPEETKTEKESLETEATRISGGAIH